MSYSGEPNRKGSIGVEVRLYGELSLVAGSDRALVTLPEDSAVRDAVTALLHTCPSLKEFFVNESSDLHVEINLLLNGRSIRSLRGLETRLKDEDRLFALRAYGGG